MFNIYTGLAIQKPRFVVSSTLSDEPVKVNGRAVLEHNIRLYRQKGYPLGKSKRGIKKWLKKRFLKALQCKTYNQAMRKRKI